MATTTPTPAQNRVRSSTGLAAPRESWVSKHRSRLLPIATIVVILLIWEILGRTVGWNPLYFSYPSQIWQGFLSLAAGPLWQDLGVSGIEFALGMLISIVLAIPVGLIMGTRRNAYFAFDPIISA